MHIYMQIWYIKYTFHGLSNASNILFFSFFFFQYLPCLAHTKNPCPMVVKRANASVRQSRRIPQHPTHLVRPRKPFRIAHKKVTFLKDNTENPITEPGSSEIRACDGEESAWHWRRLANSCWPSAGNGIWPPFNNELIELKQNCYAVDCVCFFPLT